MPVSHVHMCKTTAAQGHITILLQCYNFQVQLSTTLDLIDVEFKIHHNVSSVDKIIMFWGRILRLYLASDFSSKDSEVSQDEHRRPSCWPDRKGRLPASTRHAQLYVPQVSSHGYYIACMTTGLSWCHVAWYY